jgi:SnoaL-like domain
MSEQNLELVLVLYDLFNRRELDRFLTYMDGEIEVESRLVTMEGSYQGHEGVRRWWDNLCEFIPDYTIGLEEGHDLGDVILVRARGDGHGATSTAPLIDMFWHPIRFRDRKVVWWRNCPTEDEALEAIGWR